MIDACSARARRVLGAQWLLEYLRASAVDAIFARGPTFGRAVGGLQRLLGAREMQVGNPAYCE